MSPHIDKAIMVTEMMKNTRLLITRRKNEPVRQPKVRKTKYSEVENMASLSVMPRRSINIFGAVVLVPTSMPTWHIMPRKLSSTIGLPSSLTQSINELGLPLMGSSTIGVEKSNSVASTPIII